MSKQEYTGSKIARGKKSQDVTQLTQSISLKNRLLALAAGFLPGCNTCKARNGGLGVARRKKWPVSPTEQGFETGPIY